MKVIIIDNYDSFTFNLFQMLQPLVDEPIEVFRNDEIDFAAVKEKNPQRVVLSPGPGHPAKPEDFGVCSEIILNRHKLGASVLGVCLGHQGIVHYLGGQVIAAAEIVHGKTSKIDITYDSPLFDGLPRQFEAMRYHSLVASEEGFPTNLKVTARESLKGLVMGLQHASEPIYGVQFHPESIGTPEGETMLRNFIEKC